MGTIGGQILINEDWTIALVHKCGSTGLKAGFSRIGCEFITPDEPQLAPNAIVVVRNPLERVISWWRNQVRDRGRVDNVHREILGLRDDQLALDDTIRAILAVPDDRRDSHYRSYGAYLAPLKNVRLVALEKLTETWPRGVPYVGPGGRDINRTEDRGERPSDEVVEAFEDAYHADYLIWEEAIDGRD